MKRILLIAIAMVCLAGCSKEKVMQGRYTASTSIGTINIELLAGGNCVASLEGGEEDTGSYDVNGDEIIIRGARVRKGEILSSRYKCYIFTGTRPGTIVDNNKFSIEIENMYGDDTIYCTFVRR